MWKDKTHSIVVKLHNKGKKLFGGFNLLSVRLENPGEHMTFPEGLFEIRKQVLITDIQSFHPPWPAAWISGHQSLHHTESCGVVLPVDILHNAHFRAPQSTLNIKMKWNPLHDGSLFQTLAYTEENTLWNATQPGTQCSRMGRYWRTSKCNHQDPCPWLSSLWNPFATSIS